MKKIVLINSVCNGSTGKIMLSIHKLAKENNFKSYCIYGRRNGPYDETCIKLGNNFSFLSHVLFTFIFNNHGRYSKYHTKKMIKKLKEINPDIIHLHNIHGYYLNYEILFNYLNNEYKGKVFWTLHDCWSFTGHCPHYSKIKCNKWKNKCYKCPQMKRYPISLLFDTSKNEYQLKKKLFTSVKDMTIITPSVWLKEEVEKSFLKKYKIIAINNGIDLNIFKPTKSEFRKKYKSKNKIILLGVAFDWGERKGLDVFIELSKRLSSKYQIVLVGTNKKIDKKLPKNIISIHKTDSQIDLAKIYTTADLFINPTREDNFPTVNLESLACGTPGITFNTGGSPECFDTKSGSVVEYNNIDALEKEIYSVIENKEYNKKDCIKRAKEYNRDDKFKEYINLYNEKQL
ncbi:MAG: glycosyltransferase [Mycoplasmatota bacterium]